MFSNTVSLARAISVEPEILAASLTVYIETKAALTTFFLCVKHAPNALARLPWEILCRIASIYRKAAYYKELRDWKMGFRCVTGYCDPYDHTPRDEIEEHIKEALEYYRLPDDTFYDSDDCDKDGRITRFIQNKIHYPEENWEEHESRTFRYRGEIENQTSKLSRYQDIFEEESGIQLHFNWLPDSIESRPVVPRRGTLPNVPKGGTLKAYVTLPLQNFFLHESVGAGHAFSSIIGRIKTSSLESVSETQLRLIAQALRKLELGNLAYFRRLHDFWKREIKGYYVSKEEHLVDVFRQSRAQEIEDEFDQWPSLMLLGCAKLQAEPEEELP